MRYGIIFKKDIKVGRDLTEHLIQPLSSKKCCRRKSDLLKVKLLVSGRDNSRILIPSSRLPFLSTIIKLLGVPKQTELSAFSRKQVRGPKSVWLMGGGVKNGSGGCYFLGWGKGISGVKTFQFSVMLWIDSLLCV